MAIMAPPEYRNMNNNGSYIYSNMNLQAMIQFHSIPFLDTVTHQIYDVDDGRH